MPLLRPPLPLPLLRPPCRVPSAADAGSASLIAFRLPLRACSSPSIAHLPCVQLHCIALCPLPLQEELEEALFAILRAKGYGGEYVRRYQMVTRFFQQKRPLIILIAGSACTGGRHTAAAAEGRAAALH